MAGIVLLICSTRARAQSDQDAGPKNAVKTLYAAVQKGDAAAITQAIYVEGDPQQEMARAYADLVLAGKHLADVVKLKYPNSPNKLTQGTLMPEDVARIDAAAVTIDKDKATLRIAGRDPVPLRRVDGNWRILFGEGADPKAAISKRVASMSQISAAMNQAADEINADKYATAQEAEAAVQTKLDAVVSKSLQMNPPTSRPQGQN
jgi:ribosomal protein S20